MRIAITGGTGLVGSALHTHFSACGEDVAIVTRSRRQLPAAIHWDPQSGEIDAASLEGMDVIIHLAGESLAGLWTPGRKQRIRESRLRGTTLLAETLARLETKPKVLLSASGMNFYGDRGAEPLTEKDDAGSGFLAELVVQWEGATKPAADAGVRVVFMRFGNVLSPDGGVIEALLPFFRLGLGTSFGDGRGCWPWVALEDIPHIADHLIEHTEIQGPVNVVAPERTTNEEFTRALADAVRRPAFLSIPAFAAKLAPGGMGQELLLNSACIEPAVLLKSGYHFRQPALRAALASML